MVLAKSLIKGEKFVIGKRNEGLNQLRLELKFKNPYGSLVDIDLFAFFMDEKNVVNKEDIIFYNHPFIDKIITYKEEDEDGEYKKTFTIDLNKLPKDTLKIIFGCSIYKDENIKEAKKIPLTFKAFEQMTQMEMFQIHEEIEIGINETFLLGDIYAYKDLWKFNTVLYKHEKQLLTIVKNLYAVKIYSYK
jgi:stress response protein SCP2